MKHNKYFEYQVNFNNDVTFASGPAGEGNNFDYSGAAGNNGNPQQQNSLPGGDGILATPAGQVPQTQQQQQQVAQQEPSPLDEFSTLYDTPVIKDAQGNVVKAPEPTKTIFDATGEDLTTLANKVDVSNLITDDVMKAINPNGDANTTKALQDLSNGIARSVMQQSMQASLNIGKTGMELGAESATLSSTSLINKQAATALVHTANPNLANPAYTKMLDTTLAQIALHNPSASPQQIATKAETYFKQLNVAAPEKKTDTNTGGDNGLEEFFKI